MNKLPYHSALKPEDPCAAALAKHVFPDGSIALQWDITTGKLPGEFGQCDCFYVEPPWRAGMKVFNQRANSPDHILKDVVQGIASVVTSEQRPIVLICGKQDSKTYMRLCPEPQQTIQTQIAFHKCDALAFLWNIPYGLDLNPESNETLCKSLAETYDCVGDFVCGYGRTAKIFRDYGNRFVMSDYNAKCIGHMAAHF